MCLDGAETRTTSDLEAAQHDSVAGSGASVGLAETIWCLHHLANLGGCPAR